MRKMLKIMVVMLMLVLCLLGCAGSEETDAYSVKVYELDEEKTVLVTNPSAEYVMAALYQLESIIGVEQDPEAGEGSIDAAKGDECIARIYFASNLVDQSGWGKEESPSEKGTSAGGSVEVYANTEDAIERDAYLHGFDDSWLDAGSHAVAGTIVIRTSEKLGENEQIALTDRIVEVLTSGDIAEEVSKEAEELIGAIEEVKIEVGTNSEEFIDKYYDEVISLLSEEGFTNIIENPVVIEFDSYKESRCTKITIAGKSDFVASDKFNSSDEIVITYYTGALANVPDDRTNLLGKHYEEVKKQFEKAGFTNISCVAYEIDYNEENVSEGSVVNIAIGPTGSVGAFEKDEQWYTNVEIRIEYCAKVISKSNPTPEPTLESFEPTPEPTPDPTSNPTPEPTLEPTSKPMPEPTLEPSEPTSESIPESDNRSGISGGVNSEGGSGVTVPDHEETEGNLVWVPTNGGKKYHSKSGCSGMENPMQVTLETAMANGYTACKRCY